MKLEVPFYRQEKPHTCGPACLRMVLASMGTYKSEDVLVDLCGTTLMGTGRRELKLAATQMGFNAVLIERTTRHDVERYLEESRPIIALVDPRQLYLHATETSHGVVIIGFSADEIIFHDPAGRPDTSIAWERFRHAWWERHEGRGIVIWKQ